MSTISEYISAQGYAFKKARRVLTSPDPEYREKLKEITRILSTLHEDEKFFSIDRFLSRCREAGLLRRTPESSGAAETTE